jgi:flagellar biosynthesis protein FliR
MRAEFTLPLATLASFLLVLTRVGSAVVFVPLPGVRQGPEPARILLALALTVMLRPRWPAVAEAPTAGQLAGWLAAEAALGVFAGLLVGFLAEALQVAAQAVGLEAGFAYSSIVDPQTQADSGVLLVFAQLAAGLIFAPSRTAWRRFPRAPCCGPRPRWTRCCGWAPAASARVCGWRCPAWRCWPWSTSPWRWSAG